MQCGRRTGSLTKLDGETRTFCGNRMINRTIIHVHTRVDEGASRRGEREKNAWKEENEKKEEKSEENERSATQSSVFFLDEGDRESRASPLSYFVEIIRHNQRNCKQININMI